jgi:hypothetical protein
MHSPEQVTWGQSGWKRPLCRSITPVLGSPIHTLCDAGAFILGLPKDVQHRDEWWSAADLLVKAADTGRDGDIEAATFQLECALLLNRRLILWRS